MPFELAIAMSAVASGALSIGLYVMKIRAAELPSLGSGFRWQAWRAFLRDPRWLAGLGLQIAGYALYFTMLRFAPLSLVHTALTGGLVLFLLLSVFALGEHAGVREWLGGLAITAGLVCLGLSLNEEASFVPARIDLVAFFFSTTGLALLAIALDRSPGRPIGRSIASGLILGMAAVFAKLLATAPSLHQAVRSSALWLTLGSNIAGFALMQSALQNGRGVVVVPIFSVLSDIVPILAGILVFHEGLPRAGTAAGLRVLAFALALGGTALLATATERHTNLSRATARS
ncbi:MAG: hypothetical protein N3C12_00810 [Candidatus Binatia bacterium]|nr:hypothetical protein [Candidatus Binatia bacterium]